MSVEVVVPFRGGCPHRERAWEWCRDQYTWPVVEAPGPDPWCKAAAAMPAIERCSADIVVLADADCFTDGLEDAIAAVARGAGWAVPHRTVHRLHEKGTAAVLAGKPWDHQPLAQRPYRGVEGGGYLVTARTTLLEIPLDPRFIGWGQEDEAHAIALRSLRGAPWRGNAPLVHLWHPPQQRLCRTRGSREGWLLHRRYLQARQSPRQMRQLLREAADALHPHQQAMHAPDRR